MATQNNDPDPNTTVPHDETTEAEASGRTADPKKTAPQEQPEGGTTVPHDDA
jgi:hypothetical protein